MLEPTFWRLGRRLRCDDLGESLKGNQRRGNGSTPPLHPSLSRIWNLGQHGSVASDMDEVHDHGHHGESVDPDFPYSRDPFAIAGARERENGGGDDAERANTSSTDDENSETHLQERTGHEGVHRKTGGQAADCRGCPDPPSASVYGAAPQCSAVLCSQGLVFAVPQSSDLRKKVLRVRVPSFSWIQVGKCFWPQTHPRHASIVC
jgi:hypothetical protein